MAHRLTHGRLQCESQSTSRLSADRLDEYEDVGEYVSTLTAAERLSAYEQ